MNDSIERNFENSKEILMKNINETYSKYHHNLDSIVSTNEKDHIFSLLSFLKEKMILKV